MDIKKMLEGNWEERGVIGTRIEIEGSEIIFLWRSSHVLTTTFKTDLQPDGRIILKLKKNGLRYEYGSDYATVEELYFLEGKLHCIKNFPISGISEDILMPTDNSRYGNVIIDDKLLDTVQGKWFDKDKFTEIEISGDTLKYRDQKTRIHAVVNRNGSSIRGEDFKIVDQNAVVDRMFCFEELYCINGSLTGFVLVCDVGMIEVPLYRSDGKRR